MDYICRKGCGILIQPEKFCYKIHVIGMNNVNIQITQSGIIKTHTHKMIRTLKNKTTDITLCTLHTQKHLSHHISVMSWNKAFVSEIWAQKHCIQTQTHTYTAVISSPLCLFSVGLVDHLSPLVRMCNAGHKHSQWLRCQKSNKCRQTETRVKWNNDLILSSSSSSLYIHAATRKIEKQYINLLSW